MHDARAARLGRGRVRVDHALHPLGLAGQVDGVGTGGSDRSDEFGAVERVGADGRDDETGRLGKLGHGVSVAGVSDDPGHIGTRGLCDCGKFRFVPAGDGPGEISVGAVALDEVPAEDFADEAGGAEDDDVVRAIRA